MPTIVLASQSTSRRRLLESAGLSPKIMVSNVDEDAPCGYGYCISNYKGTYSPRTD